MAAKQGCLCWLRYGRVDMEPDPRRPDHFHCMSCGAEDHEVFAIQREYEEAWQRGEAVEFLTGYLASPEAYMPLSVFNSLLANAGGAR